MNLEIGTQLGDYRLLSRIGKGSYGVVYEAQHSITRRIDALKLMLYAGPCAADDEQRFLREIQVQAALQHPNVAAVYTAFRTEWGPALAMELVRGLSLRSILERGRPPLAEGVRYILAALNGLSAAERLGIVHRDIKPENILITPEGQVKLTDFGLAHVIDGSRLTSSGENLGTPCYMSPEQVVGTEAVDARSDVYSAGVVLYEVVTGNPPFTGTNGFAVMLAHRNTPPVPPIEINPDVGERLNSAILTALEKDPARRFSTAREFHDALEQAVKPPDRRTSAGPIPMPAAVPPQPQARRLNAWRWSAVAAVTAVAICGVFALVGRIVHHSVPSVQAHSTVAPPTAPATASVPPPQAAVTPMPPAAPVTEPQPAQAELPAPEPARVSARPVQARKASAMPAKPASTVSTLPRFTAASDEADTAAPPPVSHAAPPSQPKSFEPAAPTTPAPPPAAPEAAPASPPAASEAAAADPPDAPKRHNAVVRALGKIFHKRQSTTSTDK